MSRGGGPRSA